MTRGQQEHIANIFVRTWQRPPTEAEFEALIRDHVREEIAVREGLAMGFDEGDSVIRRRLRQKLELLSDEIVGLGEPDDGQLQTFLDENSEQFALDSIYDLRQVYISRERRGENAESDAGAILEQLRQSSDDAWQSVGDPLTLPDQFRAVRVGELEQILGEQFVDGLLGLETNAWSGPVESVYGFHLVMIDSFVPGRSPRLAEVRERVKSEWFAAQRLLATEKLYEQLDEKYNIVIEPPSDGADS